MKVESYKANWMPSIALTFTQRVEITKLDLVFTTDATQKAKSAGIKVEQLARHTRAPAMHNAKDTRISLQ